VSTRKITTKKKGEEKGGVLTCPDSPEYTGKRREAVANLGGGKDAASIFTRAEEYKEKKLTLNYA